MEKLLELIRASDQIVFFGGAGTSTESGIPDFRSESGLYHAKEVYGYPPEQLISRSFFDRHKPLFYKYYRENLLWPQAKPNALHRALAELEGRGKLAGIVTQNIDGLHQVAGSLVVHEVHGSVHRNYCVGCGERFDLKAFLDLEEEVPACPICGGVVRPDVVLYEEGLNHDVLTAAVRLIASADLLIVGGTSLVVYPAAGLIDYYRGDQLVLVNRTPTPYDGRADLVYNTSIGSFFASVMEALDGPGR